MGDQRVEARPALDLVNARNGRRIGGVGSQAMLMSLFLEDLLDTDPAAGPRRGK